MFFSAQIETFGHQLFSWSIVELYDKDQLFAELFCATKARQFDTSDNLKIFQLMKVSAGNKPEAVMVTA